MRHTKKLLFIASMAFSFSCISHAMDFLSNAVDSDQNALNQELQRFETKLQDSKDIIKKEANRLGISLDTMYIMLISNIYIKSLTETDLTLKNKYIALGHILESHKDKIINEEALTAKNNTSEKGWSIHNPSSLKGIVGNYIEVNVLGLNNAMYGPYIAQAINSKKQYIIPLSGMETMHHQLGIKHSQQWEKEKLESLTKEELGNMTLFHVKNHKNSIYVCELNGKVSNGGSFDLEWILIEEKAENLTPIHSEIEIIKPKTKCYDEVIY